MDFEDKDTIEIEYTPKPYGRKSCFHIPKSIMGSEAVPLFMPLPSYIYNDVDGGSIIVTCLSGYPLSNYEVIIQYVHKNLGGRICTSRIKRAETIDSEEEFNRSLKELLHIAMAYIEKGNG